MGKVEIKIRKKILTPDNLERYRNYPALLKKYERNKRFKRALRIFLYSLALTLFVLALIFLGMWKVLLDKKQEENKASSKVYSYSMTRLNGRVDTLTRTYIQTIITDSTHRISFQKLKPDTIHLSLPINDNHNSETVSWLDERIFTTKTGDFLLTKYLYDDKNIYDEEVLYFYSPEFGIVLEKYIAWGGYVKLIKTEDSKKDQKINQLISVIESDTAFLHEFRTSNQLK